MTLSPENEKSDSFPTRKALKLGLIAGLFFGAGYWYARLATPNTPPTTIIAPEDLKTRQAEYEEVQSKLKLSYYADLTKAPKKVVVPTNKPLATKDESPLPPASEDTANTPEPKEPMVENENQSSDRLAKALSKVLGNETPDLVANTAHSELPQTTGSAFAVQVASLPDRKIAEELAKRLSLKGFDARLVQAQIDGRGTVYRVRVHGYSNKEDAERARSKIAEQEHIDAITVAQ